MSVGEPREKLPLIGQKSSHLNRAENYTETVQYETILHGLNETNPFSMEDKQRHESNLRA